MSEHRDFRDPVRPVNPELLQHLEVLDTTLYPLPGGAFPRPAGPDPRLSQLKLQVGAAGIVKPKYGDLIVLYEHLATVRDRKSQQFYVIFRETMDALLLRQQDQTLFPEWLMKHPVKKTELKIYIYRVTANPKLLPQVRSFEDWLAPVEEEALHDAISHYLLKKEIISPEMFSSS